MKSSILRIEDFTTCKIDHEGTKDTKQAPSAHVLWAGCADGLWDSVSVKYLN